MAPLLTGSLKQCFIKTSFMIIKRQPNQKLYIPSVCLYTWSRIYSTFLSGCMRLHVCVHMYLCGYMLSNLIQWHKFLGKIPRNWLPFLLLDQSRGQFLRAWRQWLLTDSTVDSTERCPSVESHRLRTGKFWLALLSGRPFSPQQQCWGAWAGKC